MRSAVRGLFFYQVGSSVWPLVDLYEEDDSLVCEVDLPGVDPGEISIQVYEDLLIIEGKRTCSGEEERIRYLCMERELKNFRRVLRIPVPVNLREGKADYANGVVTIRFPKLKEKLITIKVERRERQGDAPEQGEEVSRCRQGGTENG
ncbi:MAG: Hsp20/alpha crystallin family protein [Alphaproteobacteria bacterium]|uniref:Hsp20/alpha crystallin family protein n=1 Tax=Candidatus Nitrobium versatile TaxID=2884831 RepID=A0A953M1D3_9BACT|nr:Hsp20/alpha crystallin family protein [Candidatus Nitrobium versatile]